MDKETIKPILKKVALVFSRAAFGSLGGEIFYLVQDLQKSKETVDDKIQKTILALQETSELVEELENSLKERMNTLQKLQQETDKYTELAKIEEEKAKFIIEQIDKSVDKGKNTERLISFTINIIAGSILFILGLVFSPVIARWLGIQNQ